MKFNDGFLAQMRDAAKLLQSEGPMAATAAIQRALHGETDKAEGAQPFDLAAFLPDVPGWDDVPQPPGAARARTDASAPSHTGMRNKWRSPGARHDIEDVEDVEDVRVADGSPAEKARTKAGRFISASCTCDAGTRAYKLYIPGGYENTPLPLVVMLHGCTQNADDFAAGTDMNALAEENGFFVAYPEQDKTANATKCWNWFQAGHQQRAHGEPAILAAITREIANTYQVDPDCVYIAGLSAGGAMAAVMAATYPELYAAVGVHSGLPYGVATDMPSAFAAMKRSRARAASLKARAQPPAPLAQNVPAIVFHGDRDATVHPENASQVLAQCLSAGAIEGPGATVQKQTDPQGRSCTRTVVHDAAGRAIGEKWIIHGAGHAWSGGSPKGSYTDPQGPSASREMVRFFTGIRRHGKK
ncbi:MAG TPA: PHB depolymerase family esterase [Noviherbaspirillum sp.]|jgi:poly(hydroxyalkanoate) depolymerase family esterase|uniref:extracellular catalytic domain type 1 short-chain-length polyhydroxyalkanoate depolymerase n=1 Tax=Noviherbaspirillum sp. TaxID=1926288 RepID=UPI002F930925